MPRIAREIEVGMPHHITHRGNNRDPIFIDELDYMWFLSCMNYYLENEKVKILAYCLMPNHVHFVCMPEETDSLSKIFHSSGFRYTQYFNKRYKRVGHLWQGRYYSKIMNEDHLINTVRYIERNPVRANLVKYAWDWKWSSARAHAKSGNSTLKMVDFFELIDVSRNIY